MQFHEIAKTFPEMEKDEFNGLVESIRLNGQRDPILLYEGKILDGRNRFKACQKLGITPKFEEWIGEPWSKVWDTNAERRHLPQGTKAAIRLIMNRAMSSWYEERQQRKAAANAARAEAVSEIAQKREREGDGTFKPGIVSNDTQPGDEPNKENWERVELAKQAGVSEATAARVLALANADFDMLEKVAAGDLSLNKAAQLKNHEEKRSRELPTGKYSVIYADPPWQYENSGFTNSAESQYPTMKTSDICNLPIQGLCDTTTVLFMWATNPLLLDALRVMKAWGFEYKTNMVWIKDMGRGYSWFLKSKHELLLIGTKSETPHPAIKPDSCFEADRGAIHSRKPEITYDLIESMYPGNKIELFARAARDGWDAWGNEEI